jgi:hypothetical protein
MPSFGCEFCSAASGPRHIQALISRTSHRWSLFISIDMSEYKRVILLKRQPSLVSTLLAMARVSRGITDEEDEIHEEAVERWDEDGEKLIILEATATQIRETEEKCRHWGILHYAEEDEALAIGPCHINLFPLLGTNQLPLFADQSLLGS